MDNLPVGLQGDSPGLWSLQPAVLHIDLLEQFFLHLPFLKMSKLYINTVSYTHLTLPTKRIV